MILGCLNWIDQVIEFFAGYLIPKGWKVLPLFRNIHHNPDFFSEPYKFDPSRFEVYNIMPYSTQLEYMFNSSLASLYLECY